MRGAVIASRGEENVSPVGSKISAVPVLSPPAISTLPLLSNVAVCPLRAAPIAFVNGRNPVRGEAGSKISADDSDPFASEPPATSTRPSLRTVAVWPTRAEPSDAMVVDF